MSALLIADGFTLEAEIPERGPFPSLKFAYRPALPDAVDEYLRGPKSGTNQTVHRAKFIEKYLVSWDIQDAPISAASLSKVPHPYLQALAEYVTCYATEGAHEADAKN